ncbi:uncharacterized protein CPUR_08411 [Claviceps purpurea 20.1]|uniref:HTH CENPB-type domain-containing protein n=1 Tax=Claviceps purpurea (strain 20.1) TaxID=1111077 RepID=M1WIH3_CLAP2|nr:uncharacterized protein CPUR_08411 [Claviceps purpurea 20.1]
MPSVKTKLTREEEVALCRYIEQLDLAHLGLRPETITDAANYILQERSSSSTPPVTVGSSWTSRFIQRQGLAKKLQKKPDSDRQASDDITRVEDYFQQLQEVIQKEKISPQHIWNVGDTGFRIEVGKDQLIVSKRKRKPLLNMSQNRESAVSIEAISAVGKCVPAFLIFSGDQVKRNWYSRPELKDVTFIPWATYSDKEITHEWIQHFDEYAPSRSSKRLLIIDAHGPFHTIDFIVYCEAHNIIPFGLPPQLTHLLHPLDAAVFQPLKGYRAKALDFVVRDGIAKKITKLAFLEMIQEVRKQALRSSTILSAFQKTGIWPMNSCSILQTMRERAAVHISSSPPSSDSSTPMEPSEILEVAERLRTSFRDGIPSHEDFGRDLERFLRDTRILAVEVALMKRHLRRAKEAEEANIPSPDITE